MAKKRSTDDNVVRDVPFGRYHGTCPKCGSRDVAPIVYGYPTEESMQRAHRGEIELGGCIVGGNEPECRCRNCGRRF